MSQPKLNFDTIRKQLTGNYNELVFLLDQENSDSVIIREGAIARRLNLIAHDLHLLCEREFELPIAPLPKEDVLISSTDLDPTL